MKSFLILSLLFFSLCVHADVKVIVKNLQGAETHGGRFATQNEADAWITEQKSLNSWGTLERWLTLAEAQLEGLSTNGKEERLREGAPEPILEYRFPQTFTINIEDVSAQVAKDKALDLRKKNREFLASLMDELAVMNTAAGVTPAQNLIASDDSRIKKLEQLVSRGDVETIKFYVENTDFGGLIPSSVKPIFVQKMNDYLAANP